MSLLGKEANQLLERAVKALEAIATSATRMAPSRDITPPQVQRLTFSSHRQTCFFCQRPDVLLVVRGTDAFACAVCIREILPP